MSTRTEFGGMSYSTPDERDRAYVEEWLWAGGVSSDDVVRDTFSDYSDADLAAELSVDWPDEYVDQEKAEEIIGSIRALMT